jgi:hypothetical protein
MDVQQQITDFIAGQPEPKRNELQELHQRVLQLQPNCRLWFDNGVNSEGKIVTNPTIGYGFQVMKYADGKTKDFFRIGISPNATGISVYILGIADKTYLSATYGKDLGKASVTGYCIKFKKLKDINIVVLLAAIKYGLERSN